LRNIYLLSEPFSYTSHIHQAAKILVDMLDQLRTENSEKDICRVPITLCAVPTHKIKLRKKPDPIQIVAVGLARSLNLPVEDVPANVFADIHLCHLTEKMWWRPGAGGPQLNNAHQLRLELNVLKKNVKIFY
jgi:hypothetical protein